MGAPEPNAPGPLLMVCEIPFWREETGAHQRIAQLCRALENGGFGVTVFLSSLPNAADRRLLRAHFPDLNLAHPPLHLLALRALRRRLGLYRRREGPVERPLAWERRRALRKYCQGFRPRHVLVEYLWSAYLAEGLREHVQPAPLLLLDTIDVMHLRADRFALSSVSGATHISREEEAQLLAQFDALLAIQPREADELRAMCPQTRVITVGHAHHVHAPRHREAPPVRLLFLGGDGAHNRAALASFLETVWPPLRSAHGKEAELHIAGLVCRELDASQIPEGVVLRGFVADLRALYAEAHLVVNPVYAGSGLKIKNVEALCHGLPLVTTPLGAEGLEGAGDALVVCQTPEEMRAALDRLVVDAEARQALAEDAHAFAEANLGTDAVYRDLLQFLRGT